MPEQKMSSPAPRPTLSTSTVFRILLISAALVVLGLVAIRYWPKESTETNGAVTAGNQAAGSLFRNAVVPEPGPTDTDGDGLADEEETSIGTDARKADTDGDRLYDYEEIKVYQTDPKRADTDNDGFDDGDEVQGRFNPNGTGPLFDLTNARTDTNP